MKKVNLKDQIPPGFDLSCEPIILKNTLFLSKENCQVVNSF